MSASDVLTMEAPETEDVTISWRWWEPVLVFVIALPLLCAVIAYYDNVHRATTNGLWKSIQMKPWVLHLPMGRDADPGNLLYFPVLGRLLRLMPESMFGPIWRRMAFFNAGCGAGVLTLTYLIALRLFRSRSTAMFAVLAQASMAFFLLLSTINEDIMPGYFWFMAALACAVVPRRFTMPVVMATAQLLALSWLFHSSLQLPGIGAFLVGILLSAPSMRVGVSRLVVFGLALVPLPVVSGPRFGLPWTIGLWAGKGVGTGWGGFAANKIAFMWSGVTQSIVNGENGYSLATIFARGNMILSTVTWVALAGVCGYWLWTARRERASASWRMATGVMAAVFVLGEGMNLYIQPQDPQMQIQPMTWAPFAAACLYWAAVRSASTGAAWIRGGLVAGCVTLLAMNIHHYVPERHADSIALSQVHQLDALAARDRTVFLFHGFEGMNAWLNAEWGQGTDQPNPGGPEIGRFNVISVVDQATMYPDRTPEESAEEVATLVAHALDEGFDVVAADIWESPEATWVDSFASVSSPDKPLAIRKTLHGTFEGTTIGTIPGFTSLYKLTRKAVAPGLARPAA
jgi:hypothetical protein